MKNDFNLENSVYLKSSPPKQSINYLIVVRIGGLIRFVILPQTTIQECQQMLVNYNVILLVPAIMKVSKYHKLLITL